MRHLYVLVCSLILISALRAGRFDQRCEGAARLLFISSFDDVLVPCGSGRGRRLHGKLAVAVTFRLWGCGAWRGHDFHRLGFAFILFPCTVRGSRLTLGVDKECLQALLPACTSWWQLSLHARPLLATFKINFNIMMQMMMNNRGSVSRKTGPAAAGN